MNYEMVIGLEVHAQLKTQSKIFCSCSTEFGKPANENTCPVCLGMPGVLPVLNKKALQLAMKTCLSTNCCIAPINRFARKNYFYPDLPKGYQISQFELPLGLDGYVNIQDIIIIIGFIIESTSPNDYQFLASDINDDGLINVLDIVLIVDIIFEE